jgi:hypothetical protein
LFDSPDLIYTRLWQVRLLERAGTPEVDDDIATYLVRLNRPRSSKKPNDSILAYGFINLYPIDSPSYKFLRSIPCMPFLRLARASSFAPSFLRLHVSRTLKPPTTFLPSTAPRIRYFHTDDMAKDKEKNIQVKVPKGTRDCKLHGL